MTITRRLRAWAVHHETVVDGCLAALLAALAVPVTLGGADAPGVLGSGGGVAGAGWLWFVAIHVPLVWRRQAPVTVFWAVSGIAVLCALAGVTGVFLVFTTLFALFAVARYRPARQLVPAAGAVTLAFGLALWIGEPEWSALVGSVSVLVVVTVAGSALRVRRTYLTERARHAEHELRQQARIAVAAERAEIAREVHDIVAHNLAVMVALADGASATALTSPRGAADMMARAAMTGRTALTEMRRLVGLVRDAPAGMSPLPGLDDLDELVEQVRAAGLQVTVVQQGATSPAAGIGLTAYRIVQEALTNTLKHAGPGAVAQVRLCYSAAGVDIEVTDDGVGRAEPLTASDGHGLAGLAERAAAYGGHVDAGPAPGHGWRVRARLPLGGTVKE